MIVERDLVAVPDDLVEGGVVEAGGQVAEEAGEALAGVEDVAVHPEDEDEAVNGLQHHLREFLVGEEARLPVLLHLFALKQEKIE